ncbi:MAG TPA: beta-ketoacyl-ACP synthase 3, partial [Gemmatimonadaceae bacterium]|nr:beta-ketoacyl-ACP synthase 3 [Gemmatimonadaceae bacterium]
MKRPIAAVMATGRGIPEHVMTNHDFASIGIETSHEWIFERSGIVERHVAREGDTTCSMAATASRKAMERAGVHPGQLDAIVLSTATPDRLLPSTAVDLQAELGASRAAAFDIGAACSGWLYGMTVAEGLIASGAAETILVVGSEKMSSIVDWKDRATCVLFGDGAGAVILQRSRTGRGILSTFLRSDGQLADLLYRPAGGATIPMSEKVLEDRSYLVKMAGREVFKHAVRSMSEAADRALDSARLTGADIDLLIPHQANVRIIEATAKRLNV